MKDIQYHDTYIQLGELGDYGLGTVSGECHWGFKPGLRKLYLY